MAQPRLIDWANSQVVAIGSGSLASSAFTPGGAVAIVASSACWVMSGSDAPTAVAGTGLFLPAGGSFELILEPGWKIAVIQASASGVLSILPILQ